MQAPIKTVSKEDLHEGALNLLENCLALQAGATLLLICEDPKLGWYDAAVWEATRDAALAKGVHVTTKMVGGPDRPFCDRAAAAIEDHDAIVYFSRFGDQDRFSDNHPDKSVAMVYARGAKCLASAFGRTDYRAMVALKEAVDQVIYSTARIKITCPLGTDLDCRIPQDVTEYSDVSVRRFPMSVPQPVLASKTSGRVALARWLTPTGSRYYEPPNCKLDKVIFARIKQGKIAQFEGDAETIKAVEAHYRDVSYKLGVDADCVHSWHAGIHPGCDFDGQMDDDPDRWSNTIFGHPRNLHFHTSSSYAPGEICWNVLDPTITLDGVALWENGQIMPERFAPIRQVLDTWPVLRDLLKLSPSALGMGQGELARQLV